LFKHTKKYGNIRHNLGIIYRIQYHFQAISILRDGPFKYKTFEDVYFMRLVQN